MNIWWCGRIKEQQRIGTNNLAASATGWLELRVRVLPVVRVLSILYDYKILGVPMQIFCILLSEIRVVFSLVERKLAQQFAADTYALLFFNVQWKQASEIILLLLTATSVKP